MKMVVSQLLLGFAGVFSSYNNVLYLNMQSDKLFDRFCRFAVCVGLVFLCLPSVVFSAAFQESIRTLDDRQRWSGTDYRLQGSQPSFVKVWPAGEPQRQLEFSFNTDATEIAVHGATPLGQPVVKSVPLKMLLAEQSVVHGDGVVVLSALDAKVIGKKAKLESHPGSHRIGFWNNPRDYVAWDFKIPVGAYRAELVYSRATQTGTKVTVSIGDTDFPITLATTGSWYRYRTTGLGSVVVKDPDMVRIEARVDKIINGGVMNLKAIVLTPDSLQPSEVSKQRNNRPIESVSDAAELTVSYSSDIRPILSDRCFLCHGPDEASRKAELRLDRREDAIKWAIVPGDADNSEVISRVIADDAEIEMPPPEAHKPKLTESEIATLRQWINEGANYEQHWAFVPPRKTDPPSVSRSDWNLNPIDQFVLSTLQGKGIQPSATADKRTLLRRAALDLTGLPPTREQIEQFLADTSPDAWSRAIDRLLASPFFGEHQARYWLDVARYADSNGYQYDFQRDQWMWRDWVIAAFNENMPFDQFTTEQIAGDLLPNSTAEQRLATGFNRNHPITVEGGIIDEEYRVEYVLDRTTTAGSAWLGLTLGCARCHSHKYDPISQKEFYQLSAFFNQVPERGMRGFEPKERITSRLHQEKINLARAQVDQAETEFNNALNNSNITTAEIQEAVNNVSEYQWATLPITSKNSKGRAKFEVLDDGSIKVTGKPLKSDDYELWFKSDGRPIGAIKITVLPDGKNKRVGRSSNGNFVLSEATLGFSTVQIKNRFQPVDFRTAFADFAQPGYGIDLAIDGDTNKKGWGVFGGVDEQRTAIFVPQVSVTPDKNANVRIQLKFNSGHSGHQFARFKVTFCDSAEPGLTAIAKQINAIPAAKRTPAQQAALLQWVAGKKGNDQLAESYQSLMSKRTALNALRAAVPMTMVMKDIKKTRGAYVLDRGEYDKRGERVAADTPVVLPPMPSNAPRNRLGLAQWLTMPNHPLTSRVTVNRFWIQLFGLGLVDTPEDFGLQSSPPSHPELLDWLAVEFVESGWDVKQLLKTIMLSKTYQQSSSVTTAQFEADPVNRFLSRGPRMRLDAETIRDSALMASGLLNKKIGGPSVFPYHPDGLWLEVNNRPGYSSKYEQDSGDKLYRRGLYTFWKRTVPPPSMAVFDAPSREYCQVSRSRTNTPLQAFVLLHDPQYVEAARALAERMTAGGGGQLSREIEVGFELALGRLPNERELAEMKATYSEELAEFERSPEKAVRLLSVGQLPRNEQISPTRHAAMTNVARLILNLSEFVTKS